MDLPERLTDCKVIVLVHVAMGSLAGDVAQRRRSHIAVTKAMDSPAPECLRVSPPCAR